MVRRTLNLQFPGAKSQTGDYALADLHLDGDLPDDELSRYSWPNMQLGVFQWVIVPGSLLLIRKHEKTDDEPTLGCKVLRRELTYLSSCVI